MGIHGLPKPKGSDIFGGKNDESDDLGLWTRRNLQVPDSALKTDANTPLLGTSLTRRPRRATFDDGQVKMRMRFANVLCACAMFLGGCAGPHMLQLDSVRSVPDVYAKGEGPDSMEMRKAAAVASQFVKDKWNLKSSPHPLDIQRSQTGGYDVQFVPMTARGQIFVVHVNDATWQAEVGRME